MGGPPGPGKYDSKPQLLVGEGPFSLPKHDARLEKPHVPLPHPPVVLDTSSQARDQPGPEVSLLDRKRVLDRDGVGSVGGTERQRARLEQTLPRQPLADP